MRARAACSNPALLPTHQTAAHTSPSAQFVLPFALNQLGSALYLYLLGNAGRRAAVIIALALRGAY